MSMLMCNETVTLVRRNRKDDTFSCTAIVGASWFGKAAVSLENGGVTAANTVKIRIPAENMPPEVIPKADDYFVRGVVEPVTGLDSLQGREYIKALTIGDNRRGRLAHWAVMGA